MTKIEISFAILIALALLFTNWYETTLGIVSMSLAVVCMITIFLITRSKRGQKT
ncbi:hypothetical protein [Geomicrobium sp. JCM 19055]|uniref:hypothetical protein n=1 Tax=Geomicrobium sp. JCM 19055 TaxID=1460649 RepID=UPI00187C17B5|nr:hypothetical protein [Geomicrobium sp. JCM 19055]